MLTIQHTVLHHLRADDGLLHKQHYKQLYRDDILSITKKAEEQKQYRELRTTMTVVQAENEHNAEQEEDENAAYPDLVSLLKGLILPQ